MSRKIEILFRPDGSTKIEAFGFKGPECEKATAVFEEALGRVASRARKPEYTVRQEQREKAGR